MSYVPRTGKLELHLTYRCSLSCVACSRASFLPRPHTLDMTIGDALEAFQQADELGWRPLVILIGGEPTAHPQFLDFARISRAWMQRRGSTGQESEIHVYSNGAHERERELCAQACDLYACSIVRDEWKDETGSRVGGELGQSEWNLDMFLSPTDAGLPWMGTCYCHASQICGVGVDHDGYALCPTGLSVAKLLRLDGVRTQRMADLFDPEWADRATQAMCEHCGYGVLAGKRTATAEEREKMRAYLATCERLQGTPMSPTWASAFAGRTWPAPGRARMAQEAHEGAGNSSAVGARQECPLEPTGASGTAPSGGESCGS